MRRALGALLGLGAIACGGVTPAPAPPVLPRWDQLAAGAKVADDERELWQRAEEADQKLRDSRLLLEDEALLSYLRGILEALAPELPAAAPKLRLYVVRDADPQAGTSAHGTIAISVGMLATLENEAQLAALLGHELGHFLARHALVDERYEAISASTVERAQLARANEDEADRIGLERMRGAGYEPRELPRMLALLRPNDAALRTPHPTWESHPYIDARIRRVSERIPPSANGRIEPERFRASVADVLGVAAQLEIEARRLPRARALLERHQAARPDAGRGFYLKGEILRVTEKDGRRSPLVREAYERAVELAPKDPDALRALGLLYRELGETKRSNDLLARYVAAAPDATDRKLVERWLAEPLRSK